MDKIKSKICTILVLLMIFSSIALFPTTVEAAPPDTHNTGLIGWEGDKDGVYSYMDGSFYVRDGKNTSYSFGIYGNPSTLKWYNDSGYLPCLVTEFTRDNCTIKISNFADKVTISNNDFVVVYSSVNIKNNGSTAVTLDPAPSAGLIALTSNSTTIQPGDTVQHDYAVAADRFGGTYGWPTTAEIQGAGTRDTHYTNMADYWNGRLDSLTQFVQIPDSRFRDFFKASFIYTMIMKDGINLNPGENVYDLLYDHDALGILVTLINSGDLSNAKDYLNSLTAVTQYSDARWKFSYPFAMYLQKTGDTTFVNDNFSTIQSNTHYIESERTGPDGIMKMTNDIDSDGYWTLDDGAALFGLTSYKYICDRLGKTDESAWASDLYDKLLTSINNKLNQTLSANGINYIPASMVQPNNVNRCNDPADSNWASPFHGSSRWYWDGFLFGANQTGTLIDKVDATYDYGYGRLLGALPAHTVGAIGGKGALSTAYNASYATAGLVSPGKYRTEVIDSLKFLIDNCQSSPYGFWEEIYEGAVATPWEGTHPESDVGVGDCPHGWGQILAMQVFQQSIVAEKSDGTLIVGRGMPNAWLENGKVTELTNVLITDNARLGIKIEGLSGNQVRVTRTGAEPTNNVVVNLPAFINNITDTTAGTIDKAKGTVTIPATTTTVTITYGSNPQYGNEAVVSPLTPKVGNLAAGKTATSSSSRGSGFVASRALDSNKDTMWLSDGGNFPEWINVDLGSSQDIGRIMYKFNDTDGSTFKYKMEGSVDGSTWTILADRTGQGVTSANGECTESVSGTYRYIKTTITGMSGGHWNNCQEFEVYGKNKVPVFANSSYNKTIIANTTTSGSVSATDEDTTDILTYALGTQASHGTAIVNNDGSWTYTPAQDYTGTDSFTVTVADGIDGIATTTVNITIPKVGNLAAGKTATASSSRGNGFETSNSLDSNEDTKWLSNDGSFPQWINVDLGSSQDIGRIMYKFSETDNSTFKYKMEGSLDGSTWTTLADRTDQGVTSANGECTESVSGTYRYVKMTITDISYGHWTTCLEFEVYGKNNAPIFANSSYNKTIITNTSTSGSVSAADEDTTDILTYALGMQASHGTAVVNNDGSWTYTPTQNYIGTDSFTVTVADGNGGTATTTVNITIDADTTAPAEVTAATVTPGNGQLTITWIDPADADFNHVVVSGEGITEQSVNKGTQTVKITGLTNGNDYAITLKTVDATGNTSLGTSVSGTPSDVVVPDTTAPAEVTGATVTADDGQLTITWINPADADFDHVVVTGAAITVQNIVGGVNTATITGLTNGTEYTIVLQTVDATGNKSTGVSVIGTPVEVVVPDTTAPAEISGATVISGNGQLTITWINPADADFDHVVVTGAAITVQNIVGGVNTATITGLTNGKEYTVVLQTVDAAGNTSAGTSVSGTPVEPTQTPHNPSTSTQTSTTVTTTVPTSATTKVEGDTIKVDAPKVDKATGIAAATPIQAEDINKALKNAEADMNGTKTVTLEIPKADGAKVYTVQFPTSVLKKANATVKFEIVTENGTLVVPENMLNTMDAAHSQNIVLSVAKADISTLDDQIKKAIGNHPVIELDVKVDGKVVSWNNSSAPVTVKIPYNPTSDELANLDYLVVWYINANGEIEQVKGAKYVAAEKAVVFTTTHFSKYTIAFTKKSFKDVKKNSWMEEPIEVLAANGIIQGTSETNFNPNDKISRGEFIGWLINTLGLTAEFDANFADVKETNKYYKGIGIAKSLGIVVGYNGKFSPDDKISRQDMAVTIIKALKTAKETLAVGTANDIKKYSDAKKISKYAVADLATIVKMGIVKGNSNNTLNPCGSLTRAEAAQVLYKIYIQK